MREYHSQDEWSNPKNKPTFGSYPSKSKIQEAGHELKENPPAILKSTAKKFGKVRAQKQKIAIMLSKARRGK